jgi:hypothetical protein
LVLRNKVVEAFVQRRMSNRRIFLIKKNPPPPPQKVPLVVDLGLVTGILLYTQNLQEWDDALFHK